MSCMKIIPTLPAGLSPAFCRVPSRCISAEQLARAAAHSRETRLHVPALRHG
jgi:hypothetical protein